VNISYLIPKNTWQL